MKQHIPNAITLLNLFWGCMALVYVFRGVFEGVLVCLALAVLADLLDGAMARWLRMQSPLGVQLDSLADAVSFGVVPAGVYFHMLEAAYPPNRWWLAAPAFILTMAAILRLARFNLDERQKDNFIGLPTPAAAVFVVGHWWIIHTDALGWGGGLGSPLMIYAAIALLSWLMHADLPMFSLKMKRLAWQGNEIRITFALLALALVVLFRQAAPALIIAAYVLWSVGSHWFTSKRNL